MIECHRQGIQAAELGCFRGTDFAALSRKRPFPHNPSAVWSITGQRDRTAGILMSPAKGTSCVPRHVG